VKYCKDGVTGTELHTVIGFQLFALYTFAIHERTVLAALVLDDNFAVLGDEQGMIARDARICNYQILIHSAANAKWGVI
jgi:hypothetical protein